MYVITVATDNRSYDYVSEVIMSETKVIDISTDTKQYAMLFPTELDARKMLKRIARLERYILTIQRA